MARDEKGAIRCHGSHPFARTGSVGVPRPAPPRPAPYAWRLWAVYTSQDSSDGGEVETDMALHAHPSSSTSLDSPPHLATFLFDAGLPRERYVKLIEAHGVIHKLVQRLMDKHGGESDVSRPDGLLSGARLVLIGSAPPGLPPYRHRIIASVDLPSRVR